MTASPSAVDVVQGRAAARRRAVRAGRRADVFGARADWRSAKGGIELLAFGRAERLQETVVTVDQRGWYEGGAALAGAPSARGAGACG